MQICNLNRSLVLCAATALICTSSVFCQSSETSGFGVGTIASPNMPTIDAPTLGDGYYIPGNVTNQPYTGYRIAPKTSADKKASTATEQTKTESIATQTEKPKATLSAADVSTLSKLGLLNPLSSLAGVSSGGLPSLSALDNLYTSGANSETNALLHQVLTSLESLKTQNVESVAASQEQVAIEKSASEILAANALTPVHQSKLLRFMVNGYDVLHTCRTIYISDVQHDGTVLLTGDRRYKSDGNLRDETFHILFKQTGNASGENYAVAAAVTQDSLNQYSFLYQLAQRKNLTASRTGNFLVMRTDDPNWKLELLLDLGQGEVD